MRGALLVLPANSGPVQSLVRVVTTSVYRPFCGVIASNHWLLD